MKLPPNSLIASGPVIIEDGKLLLNREQKPDGVTPWMFPGGEVEDFDISLEEACRREVKEEMGIDVKIVKPIKPVMIRDNGRVIILIHYLANRVGEIKPAENIVEWGWVDAYNLPDNCAPNVYEVMDALKNALPC